MSNFKDTVDFVKQSATQSDRASAAAAVVVLASYIFHVDVQQDVAVVFVVLAGLAASVVEKRKSK